MGSNIPIQERGAGSAPDDEWAAAVWVTRTRTSRVYAGSGSGSGSKRTQMGHWGMAIDAAFGPAVVVGTVAIEGDLVGVE